jgi:hypothetical protein
METTGRHLVDHWSWAAEKGLMNRSTAAGRRSACVQVLSILENWETVDVAQLDINDLLMRFQNLKKKEFKPNVLEVYKKRFVAARESYLEYLQNPGGWRPSSQERAVKEGSRKTAKQPALTPWRDNTDKSGSEQVAGTSTPPGLAEYKFPLRSGIVVRLFLPSDLNKSDVQRLSGFLEMLVVD